MANMLTRFWLKRFALVFIVACLVLGAVEWLQDTGAGFSYRSVLGWSAATALVAASLATYWGYKKHCRVVFKDPPGDDAA